MSNFIPRLSVIGAKIEAVPGTAETLTNADIGAVIADPSAEDTIQLIERNFLAEDLSKFQPLIGAKERRIGFQSELKGSGTAGTPPALDAYFRACGNDVANIPATSDEYTPNLGVETVTVARWHRSNDASPVDLRKAIKGAMGAFQIEGSIGDANRITFDMLGQYIDVDATAIPASITYDRGVPPQMLGVSFTYDGFSPRISNFTMNAGQQVALPGDITEADGRGVAYISERTVEVTFDALLEAIADYNWYQKLKDGNEGAMSLQVGSVVGRKYTISLPKLQMVNITEGERDSVQVVNVTARANRNTGNDEYSILFN